MDYVELDDLLVNFLILAIKCSNFCFVCKVPTLIIEVKFFRNPHVLHMLVSTKKKRARAHIYIYI